MRYSNLRLVAVVVGAVVAAYPHLAHAGAVTDLINVLGRPIGSPR